MIKLLVFDWDDVFTVGSITGYYTCYHEALTGVGIELPPDEEERRIKEKWGAGHEAQLKYLLKGHSELVEKAVEIYQEHFFGDTFINCLNLIPGSQELLTTLSKTYTLAIATGAHPKILKERLIPQFNLPNVFSQVLTIYDIDDIAHAKPHPFMLERIMEMQHVKPGETVMVGDAKNDVLMARNANVEPIVVLTGHLNRKQAEELEVQHIIDNVTLLQNELITINAST